MSSQAATTQSVTLVFNPETIDTRFQIVDTGMGNGSSQVLKSFANQGDAVSWLLGNGYEWVQDTSHPQQWIKA